MSVAEQFLPLKNNLFSSSLDLFVLHLSLRVNLLHAAFFFNVETAATATVASLFFFFKACAEQFVTLVIFADL